MTHQKQYHAPSPILRNHINLLLWLLTGATGSNNNSHSVAMEIIQMAGTTTQPGEGDRIVELADRASVVVDKEMGINQ